MKYCYPLLTACMLLAGAVPGHAVESLTLAETGKKGYREGSDPVQIDIGRALPDKIIPYLMLEIDAIDVSDFLQRGKRKLVYVPAQPLAPGPHELRLVAVLPDGSIEELALWNIEIRASRAYREAMFNSQVDLQVSQRFTDNFTGDSIDRTQGQGAITLNSRHADANWVATTSANMAYNSNRAQTGAADEMVLHDYLIQTNWPQGRVAMGHQALPVESLALNEFNRRGVTASYLSEKGALNVTAFGMRTEEITGFDHVTGVSDPNHLSKGMILSAYPFEENPEHLILSAVYLDAVGSAQGEAEVNETADNEAGGKAQAVIVDSYLFDKTLRLRGERAKSKYDFDGENTGYAAEEDTATSVMAEYDTMRDEARAGQSDYNWKLGLLQQRVGPWFYSPGHHALLADRQTTRLSGNYQGASFGMNAVVSIGNDNVEEDPTVPTVQHDAATINLTYTPGPDEDSNTGLFANPSYSLSWTHNSQYQTETPGGFTGDEVDTRFKEWRMAGTFRGETWYWSLSYANIREADYTFLYTAVSDVASLEAEMRLNDYFSFTPTYQHITTEVIESATETVTQAGGVTLNLNYPQNVASSLSYTVNRETTSSGDTSSRSAITELSVQWQYLEVKQNIPGVGFFIRASHENSSNLDVNEEHYQAYFGISVSWPATL